jgi:hypothetical protein
LVNVMVEVRAAPPGTWSSVPVRTLIEHVELVLAAVTDPPEPVPVEKQVVVPLPSCSWMVAEENVLLESAIVALKPPRVYVLVKPSAATAARDAISPFLLLVILLTTDMAN